MRVRYRILQKLVDLVLPGYTIVYPAYEQVHLENTIVSCGSGPERVIAQEWDNPNWWHNRAANCIAVAKWLEKHGQ